MLETWLKVQESNAESMANDLQIRTAAAEVLAATQTISAATAADNESKSIATARSAIAAARARLTQELVRE